MHLASSFMSLLRFTRGRFVRRLAVLSSGFVAGQAIILLSVPILTRLFTPAEFGAYAVFTALNGIFANVLSLRFELAVPLAADDRRAAALVWLALATVLATTLASLPLVWLVGPWLARTTEMPLLEHALWLLPLVVAMHSAGETLSYWSVYRSAYRANARARVVHSAAQSVAQIALGCLGFLNGGLIVGFVVGCAARPLHMLRALVPVDRHLLATPSWADLHRAARANWHYPALSAPASLLESGTQLLPALLIAALFGPVTAGWFGLGQRLLGLPVRLFAQAARQVFLGEAGTRNPRGIYRLFCRSSLLFLGLASLGLVPLLMAGPEIFALCFGEAWRPSGEIVQLLVPLYLTRFVVTPVSQVLNLLGRQHLHLLSASVDAALLAAVFTASRWFALDAMSTIAMYSAGSSFAYLLYFYLAWRVARAHGATAPSTIVDAVQTGRRVL